ncbi:MAG: hypothetical protein COZ06_21215 [Armatimonadetes bacterium CG_4_10_14_3_um_filter_66_18]|nr:MAG: hypothetical protein COZ06_21215 [Armatimonadetes bacterium CG_4_10_14_3_um_filter_66_18]
MSPPAMPAIAIAPGDALSFWPKSAPTIPPMTRPPTTARITLWTMYATSSCGNSAHPAAPRLYEALSPAVNTRRTDCHRGERQADAHTAGAPEDTLDETRLAELLSAIQQLTVVITGDFCLDRYGRGGIQGVSRETGQEVPRLESHFFSPGAAGTIAWNLADLGAEVLAIPVLGADRYGEVITREMVLRGIDASNAVVEEGRHTPSYEKLKIRHQDGQVRELRIDVANAGPVGEAAGQALAGRVRSVVSGHQAQVLVVADYDEEGTGVVTADIREALCTVAASPELVSVATSRANTGGFRNFALVPNEYELTTASGVAQPEVFDDVSDATVEAAAAALLPRIGKPFFVTRGTRGITVFELDGRISHVPTRKAEGEIDITGAGDSALSAISLTLAAGGTSVEAALMGNLAANITVRKIGTTGTATPEELQQVYRDVFADLAAPEAG